jgi:CelD/BcsL family acetyltransferase involved in cellulose biosynthesis
MKGEWRVDLLTSWEAASAMRNEWDALAVIATEDNPFLLFEWFSLWYPAYAPQDGIRILVLRRNDGELRAIFPGFLEIRRIGGLRIRCFSYAANGYTPYGGIIARFGDHEAIRRILVAAVEQLRPVPHLLILPCVSDVSDTAAVIRERVQDSFGRRVEHTETVPIIDMPSGWDQYYATRSASARKRLKRALSRISERGQFAFEEFSLASDQTAVLKRLRLLDARTWQGKNGTGLFSTLENERFFNGLFSLRHPSLEVRVFYATLDGRDIAYSLDMTSGSTMYGLKMGYDPDFASCSPGSLTMKHICERAATEGHQRIDLGPGVNEEKRHWETRRIQSQNWWLPCRNILRGRLLEMLLMLHDQFKSSKKKFLSRMGG